MAKVNFQAAFAGVLNRQSSIFGELTELDATKMADFTARVKVQEEEIVHHSLGKFEVRLKTKKQKSPYVTMEVDGEIISGYATAVGNKLAALIEGHGTIEGDHMFFDHNASVSVYFKIGESDNGEYLDIFASEEAPPLGVIIG